MALFDFWTHRDIHCIADALNRELRGCRSYKTLSHLPIVGRYMVRSISNHRWLHRGFPHRRYTVHMSSTIPEIPEEFKALSTDERIAYVQAL